MERIKQQSRMKSSTAAAADPHFIFLHRRHYVFKKWSRNGSETVKRRSFTDFGFLSKSGRWTTSCFLSFK